MKTFINSTTILFAVLILFGCGGGKDEEIAMDPPDENPVSEINSPPSIPLLIYPSDKLLCIDNELEFTWESSSDTDGDLISYTMQVTNDKQFADIISETTSDETKTVITLEKGKTFFWRVLAIDEKNNKSNYSPSWEFYTEGEPVTNQLPFPPEVINPNPHEIISGTSTLLSWNSSDADDENLTHDVYFGTVPNAPLVSENLETNSYEVTLEANTSYYWRIAVKDGAGGISFGPIWNFRTE